MPQLDTSTWFTTVLDTSTRFTTVLSTTITLFILMQLKISLHDFPKTPSIKSMQHTKTNNPWEVKWMKIY